MRQCVAVNGTTSREALCQKWRTTRVSVRTTPICIIHISNTNYEIADSTVSCFADDTRILLGIKDEEGTQMLQHDLQKLYKFADTNNMKLNANKFELTSVR